MKLTPEEVLAFVERQRAVNNVAPEIKAVESCMFHIDRCDAEIDRLENKIQELKALQTTIRAALNDFKTSGEIRP